MKRVLELRPRHAASAGSAPTTGSSPAALSRLRAGARAPAGRGRRHHLVHDPHSRRLDPRTRSTRGEFPTSPDPARRFERMLWFFHAGDAKYDPIYGVYRREHADARASVPPVRAHRLAAQRRAGANGTDRPRATSGSPTEPATTRSASIERRFRRRLDPVHGERLKTSPARLYRELYALAVTADLTRDAAAPLPAGACGASGSRRVARTGGRTLGRCATDARPIARRVGGARATQLRPTRRPARTHASRQ